MKMRYWLVLLVLPFLGVGCRTVYRTNRVSPKRLAKEESVVFVRPDNYRVLGTRSMCDYVEIVYENAQINDAGLLVVELGIRNRGGQHWYDRSGPNINLSVKTTFYREPVVGKAPTSGPVYESNWQQLPLLRGDTAHYKMICPNSNARGYRITLSEMR